MLRLPALVFACLFSAGLLCLPGALPAQGDGAFHEFTDKRGQKLTAKLVGVTADKRHMRILREDGQEFETDIVLLSLDDQQFVKDWLKTRPAEATAGPSLFRLEVTVTRTTGESDKHSDSSSYTMEEKENIFRITVKNLSRETLASARLDYAVVWEDGVVIYRDEDSGDWSYSTHSSDEQPDRAKLLGGADLKGLRFNGEETVETTPVSMDRVLYDGNELYREDEMIGVKVRVRGADGTVLQEAHSGGAEIGAMTWEEIGALKDPRVIN